MDEERELMDKVTKQGVRDLNYLGPQQNQNRRSRRPSDTCFHEWEHQVDCECFIYPGPCAEECRRCGKTRTVR